MNTDYRNLATLPSAGRLLFVGINETASDSTNSSLAAQVALLKAQVKSMPGIKLMSIATPSGIFRIQ